jgi:hypothetical protein
MKWAAHVVRMGGGGEKRSAYGLLVGKCRRDHVDGLCVDGRILLKWVVGKCLEGFGLDLSDRFWTTCGLL